MSAGLATLLAIAIHAPVAAQEFVTVTDVTFDKVAYLCGDDVRSGCVRVSGTLTCEAAGLAELVDVFVEQHGQEGINDLDLLDFACSTEPRPFTAAVETGGCDPVGGNSLGCFKPGSAIATAVVFRGPVVGEARIRIRRQ